MALKSKGFFLNLEEGPSTDQAIQMAPVRDLPDEDTQEKSLAPIPAISKTTDVSGTSETAIPAQAVSTSVMAAAPVTASAPVTSEPTASAPLPAAAAGSLTTAEAIASALAEAEAARPVATLSTFAPDMLRPGNALRSEPRRPGRNLKGFRDMASELFSS
ncbi:MAG: translation initiation factor 2 [Synechococcus sp. ChBW.bin.23]